MDVKLKVNPQHNLRAEGPEDDAAQLSMCRRSEGTSAVRVSEDDASKGNQHADTLRQPRDEHDASSSRGLANGPATGHASGTG